MAHIPHVYVPGPWADDLIPLDHHRAHHLSRVLRRVEGDPIAYTDGAGQIGVGVLERRAIVRGSEQSLPKNRMPVFAVSPPAARDRLRFLVEKLAELGVHELLWLDTRHGEGRPPIPDRVSAWCEAAMEQSRRAWLMHVAPEPVPVDALPGGTVFADQTGGRVQFAWAPCVAIGPEGGWAERELPDGAIVARLAGGVLRVETAAIAAAAVLAQSL